MNIIRNIMKYRFVVILLGLFISVCQLSASSVGDVGSVRQQKDDKQKEINRTSSQIDDTNKKIARQLNSLRSVEADITSQEKLIASLKKQLDDIGRQTAVVEDSITIINKRLEELRRSYANAVRKVHAHSSSFDRLMFIFSANSFHEAYRRMRYMKQFQKWRKRNTDEINEQVQLLEKKKTDLERLKKQKTDNLTAQQRAKLDLEGQKSKHNELITGLRRQGKQLQTTLAEQQRQMEALDRELDRLIAEEQRRIAEEEERRRKEEERRRIAEEQAAAERRRQEEASQEVVPPKEEKPAEPEPERVEKPHAEPVEHGRAPELPPAERTFKGSFESNKGRLLFPVTGDYKIVGTFGQHRHPDLKYVKVNNNGIDIEAQPGAVARAIFDGTVSAIFPQDGYHTVVMVRHGKYLSIYVNLSEIYVRKGEVIKAGHAVGKVYSDPEDNGRTILHFEVRKEKEKLDPQQWVK